jgi:hypothetical protein
MPLSNYAELQAHIAADLNRTDLATPIQDFIRMAESEMSDRLRVREMDARVTLTITDGEAAVPAGFQSVRSMRHVTPPYGTIAPEGIEALESRYAALPGPYQTYAMTADLFVFWPPISGEARLTFRRAVPALTASAPANVNWVLTGYPRLYVYGALWHAHAFLKDENRAAYNQAQFMAAIDMVNARDLSAQISGMNVSAGAQVV